MGSSNDKPFPAEVSRTIVELSSAGTLSTLTREGWPLSVGVRFAVDDEGTPVLCLSNSLRQYSVDKRSSLHVQVCMFFTLDTYLLQFNSINVQIDSYECEFGLDQLEQCGMRTPQCTIQGSLDKPEDRKVLKVNSCLLF